MSLALLFQPSSSISPVITAPPNAARTLQVMESYSWGPAYRPQSDGIPTIIHSPLSTLDYTMNWGAGWLSPGEYIASQTVTGASDITIVGGVPYPSVQPTMVQIWLAGGVNNTTRIITCLIQTTMGRTDERSFRAQMMMR